MTQHLAPFRPARHASYSSVVISLTIGILLAAATACSTYADTEVHEIIRLVKQQFKKKQELQ